MFSHIILNVFLHEHALNTNKYWIFWKLKDMYQQSKKVSPTNNNNVSTNKNELNENDEFINSLVIVIDQGNYL